MFHNENDRGFKCEIVDNVGIAQEIDNDRVFVYLFIFQIVFVYFSNCIFVFVYNM